MDEIEIGNETQRIRVLDRESGDLHWDDHELRGECWMPITEGIDNEGPTDSLAVNHDIDLFLRHLDRLGIEHDWRRSAASTSWSTTASHSLRGTDMRPAATRLEDAKKR